MTKTAEIKQPLGIIVFLAIAETIVWASLFYTFPILLLAWEADLGWSRSTLAIALTLALGVSALTAPLAGRIIDRGLGPVLFPVAATVGAIALFTLSLVETQVAFFCIWAVIGAAMAGSFYEPCFAFLTRTRGNDARRAITLITLIAGFASTLCFPIATALNDAFGWRVALQVFSATVLFVAVPLFAVTTKKLEQSGNAIIRADQKAVALAAQAARRSPVFKLLALSFPMVALTHGMMISHLMPLLADRGASATLAVLAASLIGPAQVGGRIVMATLPLKVSAARIAVMCFALMMFAAGTVLMAGGEPALILGFVLLFGAGYGVMSIVRPVLTAELLGREGFGAISGALALPYVACFAVAPFAASLLWQWGGYTLMLIIACLFSLAGLILVIAAARVAAIDPVRDSG